MMKVIDLNHYTLRATREILEELCLFYCEIIRLKIGSRPPIGGNGYWLYAGNDPILHLIECSPDEPRSTIAKNTFDHVAFTCQDPAAYELHIRKRGIIYKVRTVPQTNQFQIFLKIPQVTA